MQDLPVRIIRSKLYPPPTAADTLQRQRLLSLASAVAQSPLTLVVAPAGYGKSTLVSQWLEPLGCDSVWLSLDPEDSDLTQFLSYVVAALWTSFPGCCAETAEVLQSTALPRLDSLVAMLCDEIEGLNRPLALVIDDYHQISSSQVDDFLDILLKRPPRNLHLVVVSRRDPSLSIPSLRARGSVCEVRMNQLEFREDETRAFVRAQLSEDIADDEIKILHRRTEGWPAALRLASLATSRSSSGVSLIDHMPDDSHAVRAYLLQEVLASLSVDIRAYLLRTAFLNRFCPELCEVVLHDNGANISGQEFVDYIRKANLFSIALDESGQWFRFHHLFQAMLQDQASAEFGGEAVYDIHARASGWFEEHGFLGEAIRHALDANRPDVAADVISRHRNTIMNQERWHQLGIWIRMLPPQLVASRPILLLLKARIFRSSGQNVELVQALDDAELILDSANIESELKNELHGSLASMRCYQLYAETDGRGAIRAARQALELLPVNDLAERGFAMIMLAAAMQMTGDPGGARELLYSAMAEDLAQGESGTTYMTRLLVALCFVQWMDADLKELRSVAKQSAELCEQADLREVLACTVHMRAAVHYHTNKLHAVESDLRSFLQKRQIANLEFYAQSLVIQSIAQSALGNTNEAQITSDSLHELAFRVQNPYLIALSQALVAELAMRQGHMAQAMSWANRYDPDPLIPMYAFFSPQLCLARILIRDGSADSCKRASALLPRLEEYLSGIHNKTFLIETLALRAVLSDKEGNASLADEQLGKAISMGHPGGFIRVFVDVGPDLIPLLNRLEMKGEQLRYVGRILAAFKPESGKTDAERAATEGAVAVRNMAGMPEPLSRREKEVLALLVARLTNKEIGERLYISTATVKRHAHSIYEKLNVKGRREAVTKAIGLGLIVD